MTNLFTIQKDTVIIDKLAVTNLLGNITINGNTKSFGSISIIGDLATQNIIADTIKVNKNNSVSSLPQDEHAEQLRKQIPILDTLAERQYFTVFGILPRNIMSYPDIAVELAKSRNIQFFRLSRADVLYSAISLVLATETNIYHNLGVPRSMTRKISDKIYLRSEEQHV